MSNTLENLKNIFHNILLQPGKRITDPELQYKSRILSFMQLNILLALTSIFCIYYFGFDLIDITILTAVITAVGVVICYILNRYGFFVLSSILLLVITSASIVVYASPDGHEYLVVQGLLLLLIPLLSAYFFMKLYQGVVINLYLISLFVIFFIIHREQCSSGFYFSAVFFLLISIYIYFYTLQKSRIEKLRMHQLQQLKEQYHSLTMNIPDIIVRFDKDARYLFISDQVKGITGLQPEKFIGKNSHEVGFPEEVAKKSIGIIKTIFQTGIPARNVFQLPVPNGLIWLDCRSYPEYDDKNNIKSVISIMQDITKQVHLEEQLRQTQKMEAIGQLAGGIAHDFNNQLTGIIGLSELLRLRLKDDAELADYAESIYLSAKHAAKTTTTLLSFARKEKIKAVQVNIHAIIDEIFSLLEHSVDKRILLSGNLAAEKHTVAGDASQLHNALLNIAINACDAMPAGGALFFATELVTIRPGNEQLLLSGLMPGEFLCIEIRDTGIGIDAKTREHIFEPFYTTKKTGKGTGLGLSAAYNIIVNHNGMIEVKSIVGEGSSFSVYLPIAKVLKAQKTSEKESPAESAGNGRILLVDDEPIVAQTISKMAAWMGYGVVYYNNSKEAVAFYKENWQDFILVILDIMMPVLSGAEVFAIIKKINPECKVLVVSGYSINNEPEMLLKQGADGFLPKPFKISELAEKIKKILQ